MQEDKCTLRAADFLRRANSACEIVYGGHNWRGKKRRNYYNVTLRTPRGKMVFMLLSDEEYAQNQEVASRVKPTPYDVLAALTRYNPGTFKDFCAEFGYDTDSRAAERNYAACMREYRQLERLFTAEQMEELREIN